MKSNQEIWFNRNRKKGSLVFMKGGSSFIPSWLAVTFVWLFSSLILAAQSFDEFQLINSATNGSIRTLTDAAVVNVHSGADGSALNIEAKVTGSPGSVRFLLSGAESETRNENVAPYALKGDSSGNFVSWTPTVGNYTLTAEVYSGSGAGGSLLDSQTIQFSVINQADTTPRSLTVTNGIGSGTYAPGTVVNISANAPPSGQIFDQWSGGTSGVSDVFASSTTLTMPAAETTLTATYRTPPATGSVTVGGDLMRWHEVILDLAGPSSSETADPNPFLDFRFNVHFAGPSGQTFLVPGYFAGNGTGGDAGNVWRVHFSPDEVGAWSYSVSFRQGSNVAVDLSPTAGTAVAAYDGLNGGFTIVESDKTGDDFRAPEKGLLANRGHSYLTYGGSGRPFLYTGPGIPENFLGYRGFTNTTVGIGHNFAVHESDWNTGDPDWNNGAGRALIGAINYIAEQGGNALYLMSNTVGGDAHDVFMHLDANNSKDRYDNLKLDQWAIALNYAQSRGIFIHWHLAEHETPNKHYYGSEAIPSLRQLFYRMMVARFGHHNGIKWNLMEETTWDENDRRAQAAFLKAIDPYDHPVTFQLGGIGLDFDEYDLHLGETNFDSFSFQGNNSNDGMWSEIRDSISASVTAGAPWTAAWDEPQKIENDLTDNVNGYPLGRYGKMWPCLMAGGDGFMWYIQQDGGGHGFDQQIEDFSIMGPAMNWSRYIRDFLGPLPLLDMVPTRDGLNEGLSVSSGPAYMLSKPGACYAIYRRDGGDGISLDLSAASGTFSVRWFDPRNGGFHTGTKMTVEGGAVVDLGAAPNNLTEDWAVLVEATSRVAYLYGDVSSDGDVPSGSKAPYDQMLLTDTGNTGISMFGAMVESEGYTIDGFYDQTTTLDASFLSQFDVVIFGLHQKIWSAAEKTALHNWLEAGGGMLIYSDSASGGRFNLVGAQNPVGQTVTNNLIAQYGMEVTVDQANGTKAIRAGPGAIHPIVSGRPVLEGEGVSPVALDPTSEVINLIPYENDPDYVVSGTPNIPHQQNLTITNREFSALALAHVGNGRVLAMFDRQPMWNNGPGSDIEKRDNLEILRRIVRYLAGDLADPSPFLSWQYEEFGANAGNTAIAGPAADPNDDGIENLLAYGTDLPGLAANTVQVIQGVQFNSPTSNPNDDRFVFRFRRATGGATGVTYHIEVSETLAANSWSELDFGQADTNMKTLSDDPDGDGSAEVVEVETPAQGRTRLFARLVVREVP